MKRKPKIYYRYKKGLFFPKYDAKKSYKIFDDKRFKLDSWSTRKADVEERKRILKQSGKKVRIIKGKKLYIVWSR